MRTARERVSEAHPEAHKGTWAATGHELVHTRLDAGEQSGAKEQRGGALRAKSGALEPEARVEKRMKPPPLSTVKSRKEAAKRNRDGGGGKKAAAKGKARSAAGAGGFGSKGKRK